MTSDDKVNILIVDDSPSKLLAMAATLADLNQNVVTATSGREALRQLLVQEFAVIVLDVNMPDVGGFETAALIRERESSSHVPIIFVTAYGDDTHAAQGYSLGAVDYLLTPIVPEVLRAKVTVFVELSRKTSQIQAQADERIALAHEQAARRTAESANRMKDEFLATLSHELRTPLNAILGWVQLLKMDPHNEADLKKGLEVIERNAKVQAKIIEDLLDVSRIISGKVELEMRPTKIVDIVESTVSAAQVSAGAKQLSFQFQADDDLPLICVDATRFQQVVWNLLSNAVKFTPEGGTISVTLRRRNEEVEVNVSDTGAGVDAEFLPYVFERFRQADATTARRYGGLGIGLAIVRQLVEMHGGRVKVTSPGPGQGTTFEVRLPIPESSALAPSDSDAEQAEPLLTANHVDVLSGLRVVVVDDEQDARDLTKKILTQLGAQVTVASTAREALDVMRGSWPDVLVSDLGMPERDGYALIRELRSWPNCENIPAIALTAYARPEERNKALAAGFQMHIAKPLDPAELTGAIVKLVRKSRIQLPARAPVAQMLETT